ncbi:RNA polymerase sigma factor [Embleya sp. NPDC008237]|uniref:RNA polymerase sigma factor n=1 Tax=Embleya sp. NPDC008237 TaxID=3363978 RepID=UPI0036F09132
MKRLRRDADAPPAPRTVPASEQAAPGRARVPGTAHIPGPAQVSGPVPVPPSAPQLATSAADSDREVQVARLFDLHYPSMLRLATLLGADDPENIVAEAYYEIYRKFRKLRTPEAAAAYLRSVVCNLVRMRIRHLQVARRHVEEPVDTVASAETSALLRDDQQALIRALRELPARQREALVLRHWLGLKEKEIASTMGISVGSVKTHTARGLATLTHAMEVRR